MSEKKEYQEYVYYKLLSYEEQILSTIIETLRDKANINFNEIMKLSISEKDYTSLNKEQEIIFIIIERIKELLEKKEDFQNNTKYIS